MSENEHKKSFYITVQNHKVGPFTSFNEINVLQIAAKLNVHPKEVLEAKLLQQAVSEDVGKPRKRWRIPGLRPSALATCFKKRFFDVGDCDLGCRYYDWCLTQLRAIKEGGVLVFYEKTPLKCSFCHRKFATRLYYVKRGSKEPNSVFLSCERCVSLIPSHWTILELEELE